MIKFTVAAALGAAALFASDARAADSLAITEHYESETPIVERPHTVCDDDGRCWRERSPRRVIIQQGPDYYEPRERYVERRYYPDHPPARAGIYTPRVTVDVDDDDED